MAASERSLKMVNTILNLYQPKSCRNGAGSGHKENPSAKMRQGFDQTKGEPSEQPDYEEEGKNTESQIISDAFRGVTRDQGKHPKVKADNLPKLSVFYLKEYGYFDSVVTTGEMPIICDDEEVICHIETSTANKDDRYVHISYDIQQPSGQVQNLSSKIPLLTTPCTAGGFRYWFECIRRNNGKYCGKRVAVLYKGNDFFGCRHCFDLTYKSRCSRGASGLGVKNLGLVGAAQDPRNWRYYRGKSTRRFRRALRMKEKFEKALAIFNAKGNARLKKVQERFDKVMNRVGKT